MRRDHVFVYTLALALASPALAAEDSDADEAPAAAQRDRGIALSVGTGPLPLNTISLGLTGLAGRILFPTSRGSLVLSGGHTSFRASNFPDQGFSDRDFTRAGGTTAFLGYRGGAPPDEAKVVPYGIGGGMLIYGASASGDTNRKGSGNLWSAGAQAGMGLDGFLSPGVSAGVEVGGMAFLALGGSRYDGDSNGKFSALGFSSFASAQLTVWR